MEIPTPQAMLETPFLGGRKPTEMQKRAIMNWVGNGGKSKAQALREAGYGHGIVNTPSKVFGSRAVKAMLAQNTIDPVPIFKQLERKVQARKLETMTFPPYCPAQEGEQLTDADICQMFTGTGNVVQKIVHEKKKRSAHFWTDDNKSQLDAIDKVFKLYGMYAPARTTEKPLAGTFSLADIRRRMEAQNLREQDKEDGQ